ncbi:MAG TPA: NfeD family protein [Nocardioidaceae bacterium]|jgi:membrane protein implicated in regulation of membrane protease activity|nr:NfeD family protein [Nocardioidaceae bacterium]
MNLPEWFQDWQAWLGLAIALGVAELFSLDLMLLMMASGALAGMAMAMLGFVWPVQVVVAVAVSVGMVALVRPNIVKRLHSGPELTLGHAALVGKQGVVVDEVSMQSGQIRVGGELWTARPYDETEVIEPGAPVDIFEIKGATAYVHRIPTLGP